MLCRQPKGVNGFGEPHLALGWMEECDNKVWYFPFPLEEAPTVFSAGPKGGPFLVYVNFVHKAGGWDRCPLRSLPILPFKDAKTQSWPSGVERAGCHLSYRCSFNPHFDTAQCPSAFFHRCLYFFLTSILMELHKQMLDTAQKTRLDFMTEWGSRLSWHWRRTRRKTKRGKNTKGLATKEGGVVNLI